MTLEEGRCDICNSILPHVHSAWDVEEARYCRPAFERYFSGVLISNKSGFDIGGTYGWALYWHIRSGNGYRMAQVQLAWSIWRTAWMRRGAMFPEMELACKHATGGT